METHRDCSQQSLRNVGHDDADEEDHSLQPGVTQDDGEDEEGHAKKDGHACDDLDEVLDLLGDGSLGKTKNISCSNVETKTAGNFLG